MNKPTQILPAVAAAIFNDKGQILLQKRQDVNKWCIISGHVEFGETIEEAILREIEEETNVGGNIKRFIGVYSSPPYQTYDYEDRTVQYVTSYFEVELISPVDTDFENNETQELRYFDVEEIPENFARINPFWLQDALSRDEKAFVR